MAVKRLIIRPGAIGDCLVALPAIEHLRADETEVWVPTAVQPLVHGVDRVQSIARVGLDQLGVPCVQPPAGLVDRLRQFDDIVSWYGTNRESFQAAVYRLGLPFRFFPALPDPQGEVHAADFLIRPHGGAEPAVPRLPITAPKRDFIAIHPFSGGARKNWPLEQFRSLKLPLPAEYSAGPEERLDGARRFEDLASLAEWLASARVYIGNDSGISHLAAAVGTPTVALFFATRPEVWAPRGPAVKVIRAASMEAIDSNDVEQAVGAWLAARHPIGADGHHAHA